MRVTGQSAEGEWGTLVIANARRAESRMEGEERAIAQSIAASTTASSTNSAFRAATSALSASSLSPERRRRRWRCWEVEA